MPTIKELMEESNKMGEEINILAREIIDTPSKDKWKRATLEARLKGFNRRLDAHAKRIRQIAMEATKSNQKTRMD